MVVRLINRRREMTETDKEQGSRRGWVEENEVRKAKVKPA